MENTCILKIRTNANFKDPLLNEFSEEDFEGFEYPFEGNKYKYVLHVTGFVEYKANEAAVILMNIGLNNFETFKTMINYITNQNE